jgi:hypothetical protein
MTSTQVVDVQAVDVQAVDVAQIIDQQKMGPLHWKVVSLSFLLMLIDGYDIVCIA